MYTETVNWDGHLFNSPSASYGSVHIDLSARVFESIQLQNETAKHKYNQDIKTANYVYQH